MNFLSLLEAKREGHALEPEQLKEIVRAYTARQIPDYQMAAFLMAVFFRGLSRAETAALTAAMRDSGDLLSWLHDPKRPVVDKHSTGGVGDKVSLPLAPLLASLGFRVPMISGRGLGITGGTLDKLDSIPGFNTALSAGQITDIVQSVGCVICGQTARMVPADKGLYALRDVTGTVPSIPLIVASILSKKLAEGLDALILDVKCGTAAFMPSAEAARELACAMVDLGSSCGVNTRALITNMDTPVGLAAGNWLEVKEAVSCLSHAPTEPRDGLSDLRDLVIACAAQLLVQTGKSQSLADATSAATRSLASGEPRRKWDEMLVAQGANLDEFNRKLKLDSTAPALAQVRTDATGFVERCDAKLIGQVVRDLGGGRITKESFINYAVGVDQIRKPGEKVEVGEPLARVHAACSDDALAAADALRRAFSVSSTPPAQQPLVIDLVA